MLVITGLKKIKSRFDVANKIRILISILFLLTIISSVLIVLETPLLYNFPTILLASDAYETVNPKL